MDVEVEDAEDQQVIMVAAVDVGQALPPELAQQVALITWEQTGNHRQDGVQNQEMKILAHHQLKKT